MRSIPRRHREVQRTRAARVRAIQRRARTQQAEQITDLAEDIELLAVELHRIDEVVVDDHLFNLAVRETGSYEGARQRIAEVNVSTKKNRNNDPEIAALWEIADRRCSMHTVPCTGDNPTPPTGQLHAVWPPPRRHPT